MLSGLTPQETQDLVLSVGTHHGKRRLSPVEVAELFRKAIDAGSAPADCARLVHLAGPTMVSRFLRLTKLSPEIRHIVDWGQTGAAMSFETAWKLADLNETEQQLAAAQIMARQMRKEEVRQVMELKKRSHRHISECIDEVLRMRPSITRKHVLIGAVIDEALKQHLSGLRQIERDELLSAVLKDLYGVLPKTFGRLGVDRFTLVADEQDAARINKSDHAAFELAINQSLSARISRV